MAGPTRVRTLGTTAIVSLVVHGAVLAWMVSREKPEPPRQVVSIEAPPPTEDLTVVELLPEPPTPVAPAPERGDAVPGVVRRGTPKDPARIASSASATAKPGSETTPRPPTEPPPTPTPTPTPPRPGVLSMRKGPQVPSTVEQLSAGAIDHPENARPLPDYPGLRDSTALDIARARGDLEGVVAAEDALKNQELKPQKDGTFKSDKTPFVATVEKDGTVHIKDKRNFQIQSPLSATFDATDWAMRATGNDPYSSEKLAYLDRTRDQRVEIGKAYRKEQLAQSAQLMQANLQRLWSVTQDVAARKQAIFELWEDCAETGEPEVVAGATKARELLERFVQVRLAGADRYTNQELAMLNAHRRSKAVFDPYH